MFGAGRCSSGGSRSACATWSGGFHLFGIPLVFLFFKGKSMENHPAAFLEWERFELVHIDDVGY